MAGCVMNYHNTLAERASNRDWMIRYCQNIVSDYIFGDNDITLAEAKNAEAYLNKHGRTGTGDLDTVRELQIYMGKDALLYPCIIFFYKVNCFMIIYYNCVW